ncbi:AP-3 complex subunit beta [Coemansia biformis]|uniref:AP-3 complex subunit beta n=1 Tax=Coemansia biformis TaxID=1286918 RepID=A0A9W7YES9_9FUNG|nr:AP-3 complex subunit beta [Coemansia biformis]
MAEYLSKAVAFAQDAARLSLRFSEGLVDNALEFGLDTPGSFYDNAEFRLWQVRRDLSAGSDKEKLAAMKRLLAVVARGLDASEHFADVVKNVASGSLEVRRLVYIYLLRYAEQEQDLALLSVNTFQRDLADSNQVIRAMALRVMSSIRVPAIGPIVMLAVRRLSADPSPHVRRAAALAVPKLLRLDPELRDELAAAVGAMLGEESPLAVGAVIRAFRAACPGEYGPVHQHFRRWCAILPDLDEWGQIELVKLLVAYARTQFVRPGRSAHALDADHLLLLDATRPLLHSRNSAVVMVAVSAYCHLAPPARLAAVAKPLVRLVRANRETGYVALASALHVARRQPAVFYPHVRSFFAAASDAPFARRLKMQVLAAIVADETAGAIGPEIATYAQSAQPDVSAGAVAVLLACAQRVRASSIDCFRSLLLLAADARPSVATAAMRAIRVLLLDGTIRDLHDRSMTLYDILCYLARTLDTSTADGARAHIFALVAEFAESKFGTLHALDVLRAGARSFGAEGEQAKMQLVELSARLLLAKHPDGGALVGEHSDKLAALHTYVQTLARYDVSFEVRDRARALRALCPLPGDEAHAEEMTHIGPLAGELLGSASSVAALAPTSSAGPGYTVGSLSLTMGRRMAGYEPLPDWPSAPPEPVDRGALPGTAAAKLASGAYGSQPVFIAGISGRSHAAGADYSTPRSIAGGGDDLDAFLNSEDKTVAWPHAASHRSLGLPATAVVFERPAPGLGSELSSSSGYSTDSEPSTSASEETSSDGGADSDEDAGGGIKAEVDGAESACSAPAASSSDSSDDEATPLVLGHLPGGSPSSSPAAAGYIGLGGSRNADSEHHSQPLIEDTSKYWQ